MFVFRTPTNGSHLVRPDGYSSCHDDRCILISNVPPFEPPTQIGSMQLTKKLQALLEKEVPGPNCEAFRTYQVLRLINVLLSCC
jgi:hypothetical protein